MRPERALTDWSGVPGRDVWITRTQLRRRELELAEMEEGQAQLGRCYYTLAEWVAATYQRLPGRLPLISRPEQMRLIQRLLEREGERDPESPFRAARERQGLADRTRQLLANIKQEMPALASMEHASQVKAASRMLRRMSMYEGSLADRLRGPVLSVFEGYLKELETLGLVDEEDAFLVIDRWLQKSESESPSRFTPPQLRHVAWEGWYHLNEVQRRLMTSLSRSAEQVSVLMDGLFQGAEKRSDTQTQDDKYSLFEVTDAVGSLAEGTDTVFDTTLDFWLKLGGKIEALNLPEGVSSDQADWLHRYGLRQRQPDSSHVFSQLSPINNTNNVSVQKCTSFQDELLSIIYDIKNREERNEIGRVAIVYPSLESVGSRVAEMLARYGIRFQLIDPVPVSRTTPARLMVELFQVVQRGFPRRESIAFFLSPLLRPELFGQANENATDQPRLDYREALIALEQLLISAGFTGGAGLHEWQRQLEELTKRCERRLEKIAPLVNSEELKADESTDQPDDIFRDDALRPEDLWRRYRRQQQVLQQAGGPLLEWLQLLDDIAVRTDALDLAEGWLDVYKRLGIIRGIEATEQAAATIPAEILAQDNRGWERVAALIGELGRIMALDLEAHVSQKLFADELRAALQTEEVHHFSDENLAPVLVLSRLDARLLNFDTLYFCGLSAGDVPGRQKVNIFFNEAERERAGWRTHRHTVEEWRYLLAQVIWRSNRVRLSWVDEGDQPPSLLLEELVQAGGGTLAELLSLNSDTSFEAREINNTNKIYSTRDWCRTIRPEYTNWLINESAEIPELDSVDTASGDQPNRFSLSLFRSTPQRMAWRFIADALRNHYGYPHPWDGLLTDGGFSGSIPATVAEWAQAPSVTALETYAHCPFRTWGARLMRLRLPDRVQRSTSQADLGFVIHQALAQLFINIRDRLEIKPINSNNTLNFDKDDAERWQGELFKAGSELKELVWELAQEHGDIDDFFWNRQLEWLCLGLDETSDTMKERLGSVGESAPQPLKSFLDTQVELLGELTPLLFEAAIGTRQGIDHLPKVSKQANDEINLNLRGVVDRIDVWVPANGSADSNPRLVLYDYKTGKSISSIADIEKGFVFQLPLYLRELSKIFPDVELGAALYWSLAADGNNRLKGLKSEEFYQTFSKLNSRSKYDYASELKSVIQNSEQKIGEVVHAMQAGVFFTGLEPANIRGCQFCDLKRACRVNDDVKRPAYYDPPEDHFGAPVYQPDR
jgi:RecB family exonuclease